MRYPAIWKMLRASAMMLPQLGMLGGVPAPINDRIASVIIAAAALNANRQPWMPINMMGALYKYAVQSKLGYPQTDEFDFKVGTDSYVGQVYFNGIVFAPVVVHILAPGFASNGERFPFAVSYVRLCVPYIAIVGLVAVAAGASSTGEKGRDFGGIVAPGDSASRSSVATMNGPR